MAQSDYCITRSRDDEWFPSTIRRPHFDTDRRTFKKALEEHWLKPEYETDARALEIVDPIKERFRRLAADWSEGTRHISSVNDLTSHPSYQEIIRLGWDVVPLLLEDLQENKRFWFPALHAITKLRPFDPSDAGNGMRMTDAWISWGKRKGLI